MQQVEHTVCSTLRGGCHPSTSSSIHVCQTFLTLPLSTFHPVHTPPPITLSEIVKPSDQRIHPLARLISSPTVSPNCLPLTGPRQAATTAQQQPKRRPSSEAAAIDGTIAPTLIDLRLQAPSHILAISFQQPLLMPWDPSSAIATLEVLVQTPRGNRVLSGGPSPSLESDSAGYPDAGGGKLAGGGGGGSSGSEWISVGVYNTTGSASGCEAVRVDWPGFTGAQRAGVFADKVRLLVLKNYGHPGYTCIPRVLLFGTPGDVRAASHLRSDTNNNLPV